MEILRNIIIVPEILLLLYLGIASIYFFVFAVAALFYKEKSIKGSGKQYRVVILIPSYKEDNVILDTAKSAVDHLSLRSNIEVVVIADSLKYETIKLVRETGAKVLPVSFNKSTKVKSMNCALNAIDNNYDYAVVLDADNIMEAGFIDILIDKVEQGYRVVQGHRTAKNSNTNFAVLDGFSEEVNNSIFRKGHCFLGFSSSIIGSGFICDFQLFKELLKKSKAVGGFDKEMELSLLKRKIRIAYNDNALVYDEKIQDSDAFVSQRRRWLSAQLIYCGKNISNAFVQLFKHGNIDYFDKVIQFVFPPRIIMLGVAYTIVFIYLFIFLISGFEEPLWLFYMWIGLAAISSLAILLSIPAKMFRAGFLKSLWSLPKGFMLILLALIKIKGANKKFIHTAHGIYKK